MSYRWVGNNVTPYLSSQLPPSTSDPAPTSTATLPQIEEILDISTLPPSFSSNAIDDEDFFSLIEPSNQIIIRAYSQDDTDDRILDDIKPTFVVMYEPCLEFVRRVEVGLRFSSLIFSF